MEVLNFIFRLGVVFAIFSFIWFLIHVGFAILTGGRKKSVGETYLIKFVRYFFLVDVTVLFCYGINEGLLALDKTVIAGLVLLTYFIGKLQNAQLRTNLFAVNATGNGMSFMNNLKPVFNFKAEAFVISISILLFSFLVFFPEYSENPLSLWFYESIIAIEDTPIFGFIFKVIGFFFMLSIIMKVVTSVMTLIAGRPNQQKDNDNSNDFDDYEELK